MADIVAGRFDTIDEARDAARALLYEGVARDSVDLFFNNPAGQHDRYAIGGDELADRGASPAHRGAAAGAATGGTVGAGAGMVAAAALGGPAGLAAAGVGAYTGALIGAVKRARASDELGAARLRHAGMMVAVRVEDEGEQEKVARVLQRHGAQDIERAYGEWVDGQWRDFDPTSAPVLITLPEEPGQAPLVLDEDMIVLRVVPGPGEEWIVQQVVFHTPVSGFETRAAAEQHATSTAEHELRAIVEIYDEAGRLESIRRHGSQPAAGHTLPPQSAPQPSRH